MMKEAELKDDKYLKRLYSSRMRIKRRVLKMERVAARQLSLLIDRSLSLYNQTLQCDLEWLLTWKLKTGCSPEFMWCDGVELQEISIINKNTVIFKAFTWIGPESSDELLKVPMDGKMELKATGKQFKSYCFNISYEGLKLVAKKT
jgi:hypothetical protein